MIHECGPACTKHRSGLPIPNPPEISSSVADNRTAPETDSPPEPSGGSASTGLDGGGPICEDCEDPLSKHDGPGGSNPWLACKHFVPKGPKS